jgi:hypothetical protein
MSLTSLVFYGGGNMAWAENDGDVGIEVHNTQAQVRMPVSRGCDGAGAVEGQRRVPLTAIGRGVGGQ